MHPTSLNISSILHEVSLRRCQENVTNVVKAFGILILATVLSWLTLVIVGMGQQQTMEQAAFFVAFFVWAVIIVTIQFAIFFVVLFWPFLLYFWANVAVVRQRTLLALIQTALETNTPLPAMIRTYAAGFSPWGAVYGFLKELLVTCLVPRRYKQLFQKPATGYSLWYGARLKRFAAALEAGASLEEAVRGSWGLFRYDVAGMIRLGGNESETLRAVEEVAQDERDFSIFKTSQVIRAIYLLLLVGHMLMIMTFVFIKIVPQFDAIFRDFDAKLPDLTLFVIAVSHYWVTYGYLFMPLTWLVGIAFLLYLILQTNIAIFRPMGFRRMFRNTDAAKFLAVFAVGVRHQFAIPAILEMYRWTVPSAYLRKKGAEVQAAIEKGDDWIDAVRWAGFVSEPEASLLHSAERTGNTPAVLGQLARSKERSQIREDELYSKLVFIPLVFLFGAVIGTFAIAMFLPLVTLIMSLC